MNTWPAITGSFPTSQLGRPWPVGLFTPIRFFDLVDSLVEIVDLEAEMDMVFVTDAVMENPVSAPSMELAVPEMVVLSLVTIEADAMKRIATIEADFMEIP